MNQIKKKNPSQDLATMIVGDIKKQASEDSNAIADESSTDLRNNQNVKSNYDKTTTNSLRIKRRGTEAENQIFEASHLKISQQKILKLEKEIDSLRAENDHLHSAAEVAKGKVDDLLVKIQHIEKSKAEVREQASIDISNLQDHLHNKDYEISKLKMRIDELEKQLNSDLRKVRVKERELENRLELIKLEKTALVKSKDESILNLKRKNDELQIELKSFQQKCLELTQKIEANHDQFSRTVRALRLALSNLENTENTMSVSMVPLKKVE